MPDEKQGKAGAVGMGALLGGGLALLLSRSKAGAEGLPGGELRPPRPNRPPPVSPPRTYWLFPERSPQT